MMDVQRKHLARTMFQLQIHKAEGFEFEHLFGRVMEYARPGFVKVRPYGNQGDRGNDGYEKSLGRYYQVFAPRSPKSSQKAAIEKAAQDFEDKLIPYWATFCDPREYFFVFNDKYTGSTYDIEKSLADIKAKHSLQVCDVYLCKNLEQEFISLAEDQVCTIVGGLPNWEDASGLDYTVLGEVIRHIQSCPPEDIHPGKLVAPEFEGKIIFNGLTASGHWLRAKQRETWQIDDYLSRNSNFAKQTLRDFLAGYYQESLVEISSNNANASSEIGDIRFTYILDRIAPRTDNPASDRLRRDAGLVLMAKYFETCDIFEEPLSATAR